LKTSQQQQAQTTFQQGQRALSEQLRQSRFQTQQSRSQIGEQGFIANRSINQNAQSRGLGNSGLKDLSLIQSQLAQGKAINDVSQTDASVQRAAMGTKLSLQEQLQNAMNMSESNYAQNNINADKMAYDMGQQKTEQLLQLYEMAKEGASPDEISKLASILGINMEDLTDEQRDSLTSQYTDTERFKGKGHWAHEVPAAIMRGLLSPFGEVSKDIREVGSEDRLSTQRSFTYKVNGVPVKMTPLEFSNYLKNKVYAGDQDLASGKIKITVSGGGDIYFNVNGKNYSKFSHAKEILKNS
jgi:hypothetical protein